MKHSTIILGLLLLCSYTNGQDWEEFTTSISDNIYDLHSDNNVLYAGGRIGVKSWNGESWKNYPKPFGIANPLTIATLDDTLYVGGDFPYNGSISRVYKFDGLDWQQVGGEFDENEWSSTKQLTVYDGQIISGGRFSRIGNDSIQNIARFDGSTWLPLGDGLNGTIWGLTIYNNQLIATGGFTASGTDTTVNKIAKWNGQSWSPIDTSYSFQNAGPVIQFEDLLIIGGVWDTINGSYSNGVVAWNGHSLLSIGDTSIYSIRNLTVYDGELYLCGARGKPQVNFEYVVMKWSNGQWENFGSNFNGEVLALEGFEDRLYSGGFFDSYISRYNPTPEGIEQNSALNEIQLFPNPAKNRINLSSALTGTIEILDLRGRSILSLTVNNSMQFNLDKIPNGLYIVRLTTMDSKVQIAKLIVEK